MKRKLYFTGLFLLFHGILCVSVQGSLLDERYNNPDFSTPANISSHVFNFFHHSCGANLLNDALEADLTNLGYTTHSRINETYIYENNYTDYRHWYKRFQRELGVENAGVYYKYAGPDAFGNPQYGDPIGQNEFMLTWYEFHAETMDIIMFKPCYPGANISNYDTSYAGGSGNNGYGAVLSGTPYSDSGGTHTNFDYLNSSSSVDASYDNTYWPGHGDWSGSASSLAQLKCAYRGMLNIFKEHPDILFIALQGPPMIPSHMSDDNASNCREFARWMREDWLHQFDPTGTDTFEDYPLSNVVPFDFHNAISWTGDDSNLDDEYFWFVQGGFPDDSMDTTDPSLVGKSASSDPSDSHPQTWQNQRFSKIFCGGTDSYSPSHTGNSGRTYNAWINAVVNRWENEMASGTPTPGSTTTPTPSGPETPATGAMGIGILAILFSLGLMLPTRKA